MEYNRAAIQNIKDVLEKATALECELKSFIREAAQIVFGFNIGSSMIHFNSLNDNIVIKVYDRWRGGEEELDYFATDISNLTTSKHLAEVWKQDLNARKALKELEEKKKEEDQEQLEEEREKDLLKELLKKHGNPNNDNPAPGEIPY
jgi:hypothetical protein